MQSWILKIIKTIAEFLFRVSTDVLGNEMSQLVRVLVEKKNKHDYIRPSFRKYMIIYLARSRYADSSRPNVAQVRELKSKFLQVVGW